MYEPHEFHLTRIIPVVAYCICGWTHMNLHAGTRGLDTATTAYGIHLLEITATERDHT